MPKRKKPQQQAKEETKVPFHKHFVEPADDDRTKALGTFPLPAAPPEALWDEQHPCEAPEAVNDPVLYQPIRKKIRAPNFELDWLAQVPEPGQGLDDYVQLLTSRSGRLRPMANAKGRTICLLPLVAAPRDGVSDGSDDEAGGWPTSGGSPDLQALQTLASAYFSRPVQVLRPALLSSTKAGSTTGGRTASNTKDRFHLEFFNDDGISVMKGNIKGRRHAVNTDDEAEDRSQYQVVSILDQLSNYRNLHCQQLENFCIMGVTMEDLYDGNKDLFCAGMAGAAVACFSFKRYHPTIKMSTLEWWDYGYQSRPGNDSYFEISKRPKNLQKHARATLSEAGRQEYLRRSIKLLVHELGHLYGLGHCIYYTCLMMGTGHLVEDFDAPMQLCGICLRKLQWRLGFSVEKRYQSLKTACRENGLNAQAQWIGRELASIERARKLSAAPQECIVIDD